jgi:hypothetical protein
MAKGGNGNGGGLRGGIILELLAAAAGLSAFVAFVGGALMWLRLDELGLPADRGVADLPRGLLLALGAQTLIVPALVGLVATVVLYALPNWTDRLIAGAAAVAAFVVTLALWDAIGTVELGWSLVGPGVVALGMAVGAYVAAFRYCENVLSWRHPLRRIWLTVLVIGIAAVSCLGSVYDLRVVPNLLIVLGFAVVGGTAIIATQKASPGGRPVYWVVFVTFLLVGAALAFARTEQQPKLEPVAVLLKAPQQEIAGFYIGESEGRIHIAQLRQSTGLVDVSAEPVEAIVSISRDRVVRRALRAPAGLGLDDGGREEAETLLEDLVVERRAGADPPKAEAIPASNPVPVFAPLVSLHSKEPIAPTDVLYFFKHSKLYWANASRCEPARELIDGAMGDRQSVEQINHHRRPSCRRPDGPTYGSGEYTRPYGKNRKFPVTERPELTGREGFYLDLDNRRRKPKIEPDTNGSQRVVKQSVPVYYERHPEGRGERITYWFFYPYSIPPGGNDKIAHEGDWERVSVLVRKVRTRLWQPISVRYHEHDTHIDVPWADVRLAPGDNGFATHPRAYVARGSHATYRRAGKHFQVLSVGGREIIRARDDARACPHCPLWFTWQNLVDLRTQEWYDFGGAWGSVGTITGTTGPLGPSRYKTLGLGNDPVDSLQPSEGGGAVPAPAAPDEAVQPVPETAPAAGE